MLSIGTFARIILSIDLDYFFAQCEEIRRPEIKVKPVVVCVYSGRTETSGVVSTANYIARTFGVKSGIPITRAKSILSGQPSSIFIPLDLSYYEEVSGKVMLILKSQSLPFERVSIDEAFIDISSETGQDYSKAERIAKKLKSEIKEKTGLICTAGVAPNKLLSKMAADSAKPDGLRILPPKEVTSFLESLPIGRLLGVGSKIDSKMKALGISTIGDLARFENEEKLVEHFGKNAGPSLKLLAQGIDEEPVKDKIPIQYSKIVTLEKDADSFSFADKLKLLSKEVSNELRVASRKCRTIGIIYITSNLQLKNKSKTVQRATDSAEEIYEIAEMLFLEIFDMPEKSEIAVKKKIRRIGLRVTNLTTEGPSEPDSSSLISNYL